MPGSYKLLDKKKKVTNKKGKVLQAHMRKKKAKIVHGQLLSKDHAERDPQECCLATSHI
jgi:hypothetical protein